MFRRRKGKSDPPSDATRAGGRGTPATEDILNTIAPHFDIDFYNDQLDTPFAKREEAVLDYCLRGWQAGHDPNARFSTNSYLRHNKDVASAGINPFWHFLRFGESEGRQPYPSVAGEGAGPDGLGGRGPARAVLAAQQDAIRDQFDAGYYLSRYPDVAQAEEDPLDHFCNVGWREHRNPNPHFSTGFYLGANPDVERAGINPFWHYIVKGASEGREPRHPAGRDFENLSRYPTLDSYTEEWRQHATRASEQGEGSLKALLTEAQAGGARHLILSVGHDNYRDNAGGVQLCVQVEETRAARKGACYVYLYPETPLPVLAAEGAPTRLAVVVDGKPAGVVDAEAFLAALGAVDRFGSIRLVLHQLLGHAPEALLDIARALGLTECWLWAHDYLAACPNFLLRRNDIAYCAAPEMGSNACGICRYGVERVDHAARIARFFEALDMHLIAPSEIALETWLATTGLSPKSTCVAPHLILSQADPQASAPTMAAAHGQDGLRIGFLGGRGAHKGWFTFLRLLERFEARADISFCYLGTSDPHIQGLDFYPVRVTAEDPDAAIRAVASSGCDYILQWAGWPETFSFTAHEVVLGGARILTHDGSGNVASLVTQTGRGVILEDETELFAFIEGGRAMELAKAPADDAGPGYISEMSEMSFEMIEV